MPMGCLEELGGMANSTSLGVFPGHPRRAGRLLDNARVTAPANRQLDHASHRGAGTLPLRLLAPDVALASNIGALFRIADALGVEHLHLAGSSPRPPDAGIRR